MIQRSSVRWWGTRRIRYSTGSRMVMTGWAMSILARSTRSPSAKAPSRIWRSSPRFSSGVRSRNGLSWPGSPKRPRWAEIVSASWSST